MYPSLHRLRWVVEFVRGVTCVDASTRPTDVVGNAALRRLPVERVQVDPREILDGIAQREPARATPLLAIVGRVVEGQLLIGVALLNAIAYMLLDALGGRPSTTRPATL